jgi:hypothetical protein
MESIRFLNNDGLLFRGSTGFVTSVVQDSIDLVLKGLSESVAWRGLQFVAVSFVNNFYHLILGLFNGRDNIGVGLKYILT